MRVIIAESPAEVASTAASLIASVVDGRRAVGGEAVLGVATGSSPLGTYEALAERVRSGELDLAGVSAFALDEYVGLDRDHPESYHAVIHRTVTEPLGIGANGHIGFNEPSSSLASRTRVKTLAPQTREDNARFFDSLEQVPMHCVTQGIGTILDAGRLLLVAQGEAKAEAVAAMIEGPVSSRCPASALQLHPHAIAVVDRDAASNLELGEYYMYVEQHRTKAMSFE